MQARALESISNNARRQALLIEDLLDISRIVAGTVRLEPVLIEPGAVVRAAADAVTPAATSKRIEFHVSEGPTHWGVVADPARLQQVVWNLLSNAVKFTPQGGRVSDDRPH
jgi:signal transduction histidine kinase